MLRFNLLAVLCAGLLVSCVSSEPEGPAVSPGRQAQALSSTTLNWGGTTNACLGCRASTTPFLCSNDANNWAAGEKSFTDPTDPDDEVVGVTVAVYGRCISKDSSTSPAGSTVTVLLNGKQVGLPYKSPEKKCSDATYTCDGPQTVTSTDPAVISSYVKGGSNILKISPSTGSAYCVSHTIITLTLKQGHIQVTPLTLNFGKQKQGTSSDSQSVLVKNIGDGTLNVTSLGISSSYSLSEDGGFSLAPDAGKTLLVAFNPQAVNSLPGTLTFNSNDPDDAQETVTLSGTGTASALDLDNTSLTFGPQRMGVPSEPQTVTVRNVGGGTIQVNAPSIHSSFLVSPSGGFPLAKGEARQLSVRFNPLSEGPVPAGATLTLTTVESDPGASVTLSGTGVRPDLALTPGALSFGTQRVNTASGPQTVLVKNRGSGPIAINSLTIPSGFEVSWDGGTSLPADAGFNLAPDAGQTLVVKFKPVQEGLIPDAGLLLNSNDPEWSNTPIVLSGTGVRPHLTMTPTSLDFEGQRVNTTSETQSMLVRNTGSGSITINSLSASPAFEVSLDGGFSSPPDGGFNLAPDAGRTLLVRFKPTQEGVVLDGGLTLTSNDPEWGSTRIPLYGAGVRPNLALTPGSLSFGGQRVGVPSPTQTVLVKNTGSGPITISGLSIPSAFEVSPDAGFDLPPDAGQTLTVRFTPSQEGSVQGANLTLYSSDPSWPSTTVGLSGAGVRPDLALTPGALSFGPQRVNTASGPQTVLVKNRGSGPIAINSLTIPSGFEVSWDGGTSLPADAGFNLAPDAGQTLVVKFKPVQEGLIPDAGLLLNSNDPDWSSTPIVLSGTGVRPQLRLTPAALTFGDQRVNIFSEPQTVKVENLGSGPISISSLSIPAGFEVTPADGGFNLPADGGSQMLSVRFRPTQVGVVDSDIALNSSDSDYLSTPIGVTGRGVKSIITLTPGTLSFGEIRVGNNSPSQQVTVRNDGSAVLNVTALSTSTHFSVNPDQPFSVPVNGETTLSVTFSPTATGDFASSALTLATDDPLRPTATVTLSGKGVQPTLGQLPSELLFNEQPVNTPSTAQTVTVTNTGYGTLSITELAAGQPFAVSPNEPFSLQKDQARQLSVTFLPTAGGTATGALSFKTNDPAKPEVGIALSGSGVNPRIQLNKESLDFGPQGVGTASSPQTVTVTNSGNGTLRVTSIGVATGQPYEVVPNTAFDLPGGASRELSVTFRPTALGSAPGTLTIRTNSSLTPVVTVALSGNGVAQLDMSPSGTLNFGNVKVGGNSEQNVTFTNNTTATIKLTSRSSVSTPFTVTNLDLSSPLTIPSNSSATFKVTFSPQVPGQASASLVVVSDAYNSPHTLNLVGVGVVPEAQLSLPDHPNETTLDFGDVRLTTSKVERVRLTNKGGAPLVINQPFVSPANSAFSYVGPSTQTIPAGGFLEFQVAFRPKEKITASATLSIPSDAVNAPSSLTLIGKGTYSEVKASPPAIFFGDVRVGDESNPVAVTISNQGSAPLTVQGLSVTGSFVTDSPALPDGGTPTLPLMVPSNKEATFNVRYKPTEAVTQNGSVTILTDANEGGGTQLPDGGIVGVGTVSVTLQGKGTIAGIELSPDAINFGKQRVTEISGVQPVIITNTGSAPLKIKEFIFSNGAFSIPWPAQAPAGQDKLPSAASPLVLGASESKAVPIVFAPMTLGSMTGRLHIDSNAAVSPAPLELSGEGVDGRLTSTPSVVAFEGVDVGSVGSQKPVTLTNSGGAALKILRVIQPSEPSFSISVPSSELVLEPNATRQLTVTFVPNRRGNLSGDVVFETDARINPSFNLALFGTGMAPAVSLDPKIPLNFGNANVGVTVTQSISVVNEGERDLYVSNIAFADSTPDGSGAAQDFKTEVTFPITVPPNKGSVTVPLKFSPRVVGQREAKAIFYTNDKPAEAVLLGVGTSPTLELSEPAINFANVLVGSPSTPRALTITNQGSGPLTLSAVRIGGLDAAFFTMAPIETPLTLPAKGSAKVSLTFRPDAERSFQGELVLVSNDPQVPSASVTLSGVGVRQQIQLSESSLDFGQQLLNNTSGLRKVRVTNSSDSNVTLSGLAVEGEGFAQSRLTLPLVLAPGQGQDLGVTFTPLTETEVAGKLKISFSDPPLQLEVGLRGRGIRSVLAVTPGTLEFGAVRVGGARREQPFTLTNLSSETVILAAPEMTDRVGEPFVYDAAILSGRALEPNQSVIVPVSYQPLVETLSLAKLSFGTTTPPKPQAATLSLSGRATLRLLGVDTTSLDFGRVDVGDPVEPKVVTITNKSPQAQRVLVMLKSVEGTPFSVDAKNLADPIPAGGTATFTVSFTPEDSGSKDNEVQVWIDGDQTLTAAEVVIAVKGQGRDLTGSGSGCSCDTGAGAAGMLALLALVGLGSRRRRRA